MQSGLHRSATRSASTLQAPPTHTRGAPTAGAASCSQGLECSTTATGPKAQSMRRGSSTLSQRSRRIRDHQWWGSTRIEHALRAARMPRLSLKGQRMLGQGRQDLQVGAHSAPDPGPQPTGLTAVTPRGTHRHRRQRPRGPAVALACAKGVSDTRGARITGARQHSCPLQTASQGTTSR